MAESFIETQLQFKNFHFEDGILSMTDHFTRVRCPNCKELSLYSPENPHRPFCSARCRGDDLVRWADGDYRIPVQSMENEIDLESALDQDHIDEEDKS